MKAISIHQPYAHLIMEGLKCYETRTWQPPASLIGQRIAIHASVNTDPIKAAMGSDYIMGFWHKTERPLLPSLPRGRILGTVRLAEALPMTLDMIMGVPEMEAAFGDWTVGNWAWRVEDPEPLAEPEILRGQQGFFRWEMADGPREGCQAA